MQVLRPLARIWTTLLALTAMVLGIGLMVRWLLPIGLWDTGASLSHTIPGDGATGVLPQSVLVLEFSEAMNRAATQAAIELTPATTGSFQWSEDARQLTFTPDSTLSPDTDYTLRLGTGALSRWWHPLDTPYEIRFHTAPLPAVIAALPNGNDTPLDGALAVIFNQPMVAPEALNQPVTLPQLQIEPSAAVQLHWLDQMTLLVRPAHPWRAATHYTATISPDLSDLHGATLGQPFSWHWSTAWPSPLARTSVAATRRVGAHQPLVLTLSAPLDERLLRTALRTDPPAAVEISTAQISTTQVVTLTPQLGWEYDRTYQVWLQTDDPHLTPAPDLAWRFQVEPQPSLIAFFPGQDQSLAAEQEVRLIFSTPMDESALRDGLRIDPPVGELGLRVHETEVRLQPDLQPSQAYTITIAASTRDRSGEPLGISETLRLRAAAGEPTLRAPAARSNVISVPANQTVRILLERINLSQLDLSLYQLDTPTAVRAMGLAADEWASFNPERYGQHLTRSWQLRLNDPRDTPTKSLIPVEINTDEALPTGFYYLRVRAHEGPQADLLLQVSQLHLTLSQNDSQVLVWATDQTNGRPIADVPLMLYAGEVLVAHGQTDAAGVWKQALQRPDAAGQYLVIADGADPALVRGDWQTSPAEPNPPRYHTLLFLSRPSYLPGESVQLSGFVRVQSGDQRLALPAADTNCRMRLESDHAAKPSVSTSCTILSTGIVSGSLPLASSQPPGDYRLLVQVGDSNSTLALRVTSAEATAELHVSEATGSLSIHASRSGRPLAGATISWTLDLEAPTVAEEPGGFHFDLAKQLPPESSGSGEADADGNLRVNLPLDTGGPAPLRYRLRAEVRAGERLLVSEQHAGQIAPSTPRVGLRLAARVVSTSERAVVEILTLVDPDRPAPGQSVRVAIYRAGDSDGDPVISRNAISDIQGRRDVQLVQLQPGAYTVVATLGDQSSHVGLWVVGGRYAGWANSPGQVAVISDRASYRPGDVAQLLVTQPYARAQLLLSSEQGKLLSVTAYELRASQLITLSITPEMAPAVTIGALIAAGGERLVGSSRLYVVDDRPRLSVDLASDATRYSPASSATLSITASIGGVPSAADVLVRIEPAQVAGGLPPLAEFAPGPPLPLATAMLRAEVDEGESDKTRSSTVVVQGDSGSALQADDRIRLDGHATLRVTLPDISGDWRISAYAVSDDGQVATSTQIVTTRDALEFSLSAPQMLRTSDQAVLSLLVHNTLSISQSLQIGLEADGGKIDATTPSERQVILAPGDSQRLNWRVGPQAGARVIKLRYALSGEPPIAQLSRDLTIEAAASPANESTTSRPEASRSIILQQEYLDPQSDGPINLSNLRSGALLRLRVSLICTEQIAQANLEIPLPGGLQPLKLIAQPPFATAEPADEAGHQLLVRAANLSPGVYSITALVRADAQGRFSAPGARLRIGNDATPIVALPPGQRLIIGKDEQP